MFDRRISNLGTAKILTNQSNFTGLDIQTIKISSGKRLIFYIDITSLTGLIDFSITTAPSEQQTFSEIYNIAYNAPGQYSIPIAEFQRLIVVTTSATNATYSVSITGIDNNTTEEVESILEDISSNITTSTQLDDTNSILEDIDTNLQNINTKSPSLISNRIPVDGSGVTQPISVVSLPLPSGASTAANQSTQITSLSSIDTKLSNQATASKQDTGNTSLSSIDTKLSSQATAANQNTEITALQILDDVPSAQNAAFSKGTPVMGQLDDSGTTAATEDNVAALRITAQRAVHTNLRNNAGTEIATASNPVRIDPTGTTPQPASQSGTWNITNVSGTVSLPTGASTEATLSSLNSKVTAVNTGAVVVSSSALPSGAATEATLSGIKTGTDKIPASPSQEHTTAASPNSSRLSDGSAFYKATTPTDTQPISAASLPLPSGASTSALQTTGNTSLSSIDGKLATLGQKAMTGSLPVVLASDQSNVPINNNQIAGNTISTGNGTVGTGVQRVAIASDNTAFNVNSVQSGTWNITNISGSVSLPTGAATSANQSTEITALQILDNVPTAQNGAFSNGTPVMGQLDDTSTTVATEDNCAAIRITPQRAIHSNLRSVSGTEFGTNTNPLITTNQTPSTYIWNTPDAVAGANKLFCDLFNASGSGVILNIKGIYVVVKNDVAVAGTLSIRLDLYRITAVGTGGTAAVYKSATRDVAGGSISPRDTANAALPAQVTGRHLPTGGATIGEWLNRFEVCPEETNAAAFIPSGQTNYCPIEDNTQGFILRANEGILIKQGAVASVNNVAFRIVFTTQ